MVTEPGTGQCVLKQEKENKKHLSNCSTSSPEIINARYAVVAGFAEAEGVVLVVMIVSSAVGRIS